MIVAAEHFTWIGYFLPALNPKYYYVYSALLSGVLLASIGFYVKRELFQLEAVVTPSPKVNLLNILEVGVESLYGLFEGILGHDAKKHMPLLGGIFFYIFVNNILGLIPGVHAATDHMNTNLGIAIIIFFYYNFYGFKAHGIGYLKHFLGPIWVMAPLIGAIEIIGHCVRPVTLSVRLLSNMTADHMVLSLFSDMVPWVVPVIFMAFGIFVSFVQAFVFTLLSSVYVGLATSHEH